MKRIPMVVVTFGYRPGTDARRVRRLRHRLFLEYRRARPPDVDLVRVIALAADAERQLLAGLDVELRAWSHRILRMLGSEGDEFLANEPDYQFFWTHEPHPRHGWVHVLYIVRWRLGPFLPDPLKIRSMQGINTPCIRPAILWS